MKAFENCLRTPDCLAGTTVVALDSASVVSVLGAASVVDSVSSSPVVAVPALVLVAGVLVSSTIVHTRPTQAALAPSSSQSASTTQASFFSEVGRGERKIYWIRKYGVKLSRVLSIESIKNNQMLFLTQ